MKAEVEIIAHLIYSDVEETFEIELDETKDADIIKRLCNNETIDYEEIEVDHKDIYEIIDDECWTFAVAEAKQEGVDYYPEDCSLDDDVNIERDCFEAHILPFTNS